MNIIKWVSIIAISCVGIWILIPESVWLYYERKNLEPSISAYLELEAKDLALIYRHQVPDDAYLSKLKDYWGNTLKVEFDGRVVKVTSAGPDKKFGTSDDIQVKEEVKK